MVKNFASESSTLTAEVFSCNSGGTGCVSLLQQQWTFNPWNVGGVATWTERQLTVGSLSTTLVAGTQIHVVLKSGTHDLWLAMSGDRPTALQLTI